MVVGIAPIMQLGMCMMKIVHIQWNHLLWNTENSVIP